MIAIEFDHKHQANVLGLPGHDPFVHNAGRSPDQMPAGRRALSIGAITDWREELARTLRGLKPGDWDHRVLVDARGRVCFRIEFKEVCVTIGEITAMAAEEFIGKINDADVAGVPAGHLLVKGIRLSRFPGVGKMVLVVNQQPWNTTYNPSDDTIVDFRDAAGQLVYQAADFGMIL